jgi:Na+/melibiose symporter-like transporter
VPDTRRRYLIRSEGRRTGHDSPAGVLTALAVATQTIAVIGPPLGGLLIGLGGWRTTFAVNIPPSIACLVIGGLRLPTITSTTREADGPTSARPDFAGIASFAAMLVSLLLYLMTPRLDRAYLLGISGISGAVFAAVERRVAEPFIDLRVLGGNLALLATYARNLLASIVSYAFLYGFTQWLEDGRRLSPSQAGLVLLPMFGIAIIVSGTTGRRKEVRIKLLVGATTQVIACALLLVIGSGSAIWVLVLVIVTVGVPQGLNSLANQNALYYQADPARIGSSAGLLRTFTYLGAIIASAANGFFLRHRADTAGLHHLAVFILVIAALLLVLTVVDGSLSRVGVVDA